jgi:DNA-directed RNA polymerase specialized sigma24 family protein
VAEIAATLGLSVNSVKTHLQRGLRALEARLEVRVQ